MVTCTAGGLTVTWRDGGRTFAPGDQIDPDAVAVTRAGGEPVTWRDALGPHLETHFAPVPEPHAAVKLKRKAEE